MDLRSWFRSSVVLIVLMFGILLLGVAIGASIGPVELGLWLAILVVGLVLCAVGSRRKSGASGV